MTGNHEVTLSAGRAAKSGATLSSGPRWSGRPAPMSKTVENGVENRGQENKK